MMTQQVDDTFPSLFDQPVDDVARQLFGCELVCQVDDKTVRVRIVETESYDENDEASHSYRGKGTRNATMFGPPGHLYVYFIYGMDYCCNVVTGPAGHGSAVLIRAVEPLDGKELLEQRRGVISYGATNGPSKTSGALAIDLSMNGHDLRQPPMKLLTAALHSCERIATSPRIGISRARNVHRRFYIEANPYVSRPTKKHT